MAVTYDSTFRDSPPESQDHGRGGERIRETRLETLLRFQTEHNVGDATTAVGYSDDGRHSEGSARAFARPTLPTALQRPDSGGNAVGPTGFSPTLGAADEGRLWVDESGGAQVLRYLADGTTSPVRFSSIHGYNNHFMNGAMLVWQRNSGGTISCPIAPTETFTADRWYVRPAAATHTVQRIASPFTGPLSTYAMQINSAVGGGSITLGTRIESSLVPRLRRGGDLNVSWRIRNAGTGTTVTPSLIVNTANATDNFAAVTLAATPVISPLSVANNTETYITGTFDSSGFANSNGLEFELTLTLGAAFTAGSIQISEFLLEFGLNRSTFVEPEFHTELAACQRYYEKTFNYATTPADNAGFGGCLLGIGSNISIIREAIHGRWSFAVPKHRSNYTLTYYNPSAGAAGNWWNTDTNADAAAGAVTGTHLLGTGSNDMRSQSGVVISNSAATAGSDQNVGHLIHVTCSAEPV